MSSTYEEIRANKRSQIENFFHDNLGREFSSSELHMKFGPAFRSRVSEINRDEHATVRIKNTYTKLANSERSQYYGVAAA